MFGFVNVDLPYRARGHAAAQMKGFQMRHTRPDMSYMDDSRLPAGSKTARRQHHMGLHGPFIANRFEELRDSLLPRSMSSGDGRNEKHRYRDSTGERKSFEEAAALLVEELDHTADYCQFLDQSFRDEMKGTQHWAPPKVIDSLWTMRVDWNGVEAIEFSKNTSIKAPQDMMTYKKHAFRVMRAWEELGRCGPLPADVLRDPDSKLRPVEVKIAMRKLHGAFQSIGELLRVVRTDRQSMRALIDQLVEARDLLLGIECVWRAPLNEPAERQTQRE